MGSGLRLRSWRPEWAAAAPHALAELFAFLRSHLRPALHHAAPPKHVRTGPSTKPSQKDLAQNQQAEGLPEADQVLAEEGGHHPIPKPQPHQHKPKPSQLRKQHTIKPPQYHFSLHHFMVSIL